MSTFNKILDNITGSHVYIQTHDFPDPDAIASAYGLAELMKIHGIDASICYRGKIERYSTNGMVKALDIDMIKIASCEDIKEDSEIILVDSQKGNSNIIDTDGDEIICIDHHPTFVEAKYRFSDIRPEMGACSTIIAEYYMENNIPMDRKVATALMYGIKMDTLGLSRGVSVKDIEAYSYLFELADHDVMNSLEHCSISLIDLKAYGNAINSIKIYNNLSFANTGCDCPEGLIASVSDFMLNLIEVEFSVVYSIKKDGIKLSIRSSGDLDAGKITNKALAGLGSGGGHASMAGGFVPFGKDAEDPERLIEEIEDRFLEIFEK